MAAAANQPLLCVIDDAQWLDEVSVQTLGFVARRLLAEPVALVFAVRQRGATLPGLPELAIRASPTATRANCWNRSCWAGSIRGCGTVSSRRPAAFPWPCSRCRETSPRQNWPAGSGTRVRSSAGRSRRSSYAASNLYRNTQRLLLVAAAEPVGDAAFFCARCPTGYSGRRTRAGRSRRADRIRPAHALPHPLMRSAAYRAAELTDVGGPPGVGRGDRSPVRSRPSGLARRQCRGRSRRRSRRGTGGLRGPGPEQGRSRRGGGLPGACDGPHVGPGASWLQGTRRRTGQAGSGSARSGLRAARDSRAGSAVALQRAQIARMRAQMEFVRSRAGEAGAPKTSGAAALLLSAARGLENSTTTWPERRISRRSPPPCTRADSASPAIARGGEGARAAVDRLAELRRPIDFLLSGMTSRILDGPGAGSDHLRSALELWNTDGANDARPVLAVSDRTGIRRARTLGRCGLAADRHRDRSTRP